MGSLFCVVPEFGGLSGPSVVDPAVENMRPCNNHAYMAPRLIPLWIVRPVEGLGHQLPQVREPVSTYLANRWEAPGQGVGRAPIPVIGGRPRRSTRSATWRYL